MPTSRNESKASEHSEIETDDVSNLGRIAESDDPPEISEATSGLY